MRKTLMLLLGVCVVLGLVGGVRADDQADAKALIDKAIKAMGGEGKVARLKNTIVKGKASFQEGGQQIAITYEGSLQGMDQCRMEMEMVINGMNMKFVTVINGDKGWFKGMNMVQDAPKEVLTVIKESMYAMRMPHTLPALQDKAFKLSPLGEIKIGDRPAVGLLIVHKDHKDVNFYFDKENGFPVKSEIRLTDPQGKEITLEYVYGGYKDFDGLKHCTKVTIKGDGKEFTMEVSEVKPQDKLDDSLFTKP